MALVQTVDFFTPVVDDARTYGRIAATNALSDVYAMGGRPLTALAILGIPSDVIPTAVVSRILRGGLAAAKAAGCAVIGGHTIQNQEPIYGLAVTGLVLSDRVMTNTRARPGDVLILTKPLGTGIATTAIKRGECSVALERSVVHAMTRLNAVGAALAEQDLVRAATDITGFGLLGHLASLCRASKVSAEIWADQVPALNSEIWDLIAADCIPGGSRENAAAAEQRTGWRGVSYQQKVLLTDAQTSGGLLLCVSEANRDRVHAVLRESRSICAAEIGVIQARGRKLVNVLGTGGRASARGPEVTPRTTKNKPGVRIS